MSNKDHWFKFYHRDWRNDSGVLQLSRAAQGDFVRLLCFVYDGTSGFVEGKGGKPLDSRAAAIVCGIDAKNLAAIVEAGCLELINGCPFSAKALEVLQDSDAEERGKSDKARKAALVRWAKEREQTMRGQCSSNAQALPGQCLADARLMLGSCHAETETETEQDPTLSSVLDPQRHPAPAREEAGRRETDSDFWGPKIEAVYQAIHGQAPQPGSREAIAAALRTTRATDLVLAIEGAKRNPWAQQDRRRQILPGILSPKRLDGHIQDARSFYGWTGDQGEAWAEGMMRSHGGDK